MGSEIDKTKMQILKFGGIKMELKKIIAGHLLVLGLFLPHAVSAEDFTFNVGVNLANMHPDASLCKIECTVRNKDNNIIGSQIATFTIAANSLGNFETSIPIRFNATNENNPADATSYSCALSLRSPEGDFLKPTNSPIFCIRESNIFRCPKEGTPFTRTLTGTIP